MNTFKRKRRSKNDFSFSKRHVRRLIQKDMQDIESEPEYSSSESSETENCESENNNTISENSVMSNENLVLHAVEEPMDPLEQFDVVINSPAQSYGSSIYEVGDSEQSVNHSVSENEDSSDGSDPENLVQGNAKFVSDLTSWALKYDVRHNALSDLLLLLREHTDCPFPKSSRTLLKTPTETELINIGGGQYCHFGLAKAVVAIAKGYERLRNPSVTIDLFINIDGAPLAESTKSSLWPILCSDRVLNQVFIIGAYYGLNKPESANEFLQPFVTEVIDIMNNGVLYKDRSFRVKIHGLICDAPAKSFVLGVKSHMGYYSCTKCTIEGQYKCQRICFPETNMTSDLRTDEKFMNNEYEDYQLLETILKSIPDIKLVKGVPLDPMHLLFLGVVKKLISLLLKGPLPTRSPDQDILRISEALLNLRPNVPSDFVRKPRPLKDFAYWKATEFRQFLLYTGPVVLKNIVREDVYLNFLTLHVAATILSSPIHTLDNNCIDYAHQLLVHFVKSFGIIYGEEFMSHNIHNLLHLSADVKTYGPIDSFSAFRFENFIGMIIRKIRKPERPLQQLARRYAEIERHETADKNIFRKSISLQQAHDDGPIVPGHEVRAQWKIMRNSSYFLRCDDGKNDCCLLSTGEVIRVLNIVEKIDGLKYIIGKRLVEVGNLYTSPCESKKWNISIVEERRAIVSSWLITRIQSKMFRIPYGTNFVVLPIVHTSI